MKKICKSFLLVLALIVLMPAVYAKAEETVSFDYDYSEINQEMQSIAGYFAGMTDIELDYYIDNYVGMNKAAFESIKAVKDEDVGEYISVGDCTVKEHKDYITAESTLKFKNDDVKLKVKFQYISQEVMPVSIEFSVISDDKSTSMGEKMSTAAMNMVMGMGTVFIVLIFLSLVISLFAVIPVIQKKFEDKKKGDDTEAKEELPVIEEEEELTDDLELVAVIMAAIAASENGSTDGFVVRSIKRSPQNKWKNA